MSTPPDPRVFFAAERTLMAWNRTALTLMAFGFVLERFGLFVHILRQSPSGAGRDASFWLGLAFMALAVVVLVFSVIQYRSQLASLGPSELPQSGSTWLGVAMNIAVAVLGLVLMAYLYFTV